MEPARDVGIGHEFCCEILKICPGCTGRFNAGTRVVSVPRLIVDGRMESGR